MNRRQRGILDFFIYLLAASLLMAAGFFAGFNR